MNSVLDWLNSTIRNVENQTGKFEVGSSHHSLIKNRVKALKTSLLLLENKQETTIEDLKKAIEPMKSIVRKNTKAQEKHNSDTVFYKRLQRNIDCAQFCVDPLEDKLK